MKFEFKVIRRTISLEEHTVEIEASSLTEAHRRVLCGEGDHISLDRDEPQSSQMIGAHAMPLVANSN